MISSLRIAQTLSLVIIMSACATSNENPDKPPIVEVFACSDYCPGPEEKYLKRAYEGIQDAASCEAIGGKPYTFIGWGSHFVCLAD